MMNVADTLNISPYSLIKKDKEIFLNLFLNQLSRHHYDNCPMFAKMMDGVGYNPAKKYNYTELPFLPVKLFKMFDLQSVEKQEIVKVMTSSGTSGQSVSRIYLDRETASNQIKVLTKIVSSFIGNKRMPMIIIDTEAMVKNRRLFSARGAGILGFSMFGNKRIYALNEDMNINVEKILDFLNKFEGERIFLFGFTFMIWEHFYKVLKKNKIKLDISNGVLIHGGGWKKLIDESISPLEFKNKLHDICGIKSVHDYYGMVEQTGSIYMECEKGYLHAPIFSDIIIRRAFDFSIAEIGEKGIIQVLSILPNSYPGHSLLTEDEGVLIGEDDCMCGRLGKYFKIVGRLKNAEIRGCSDTYAEKF
jgi:phenylacetate-coenzyme A ligase PaaK-like adenylate-forming protein